MMRTSNCGQLNISSLDREVVLAGWVDSRRDHGGLIFIDLRDRWGVTQIVFNPESNPGTHRLAETLRSEFVIRVRGWVAKRPEGTANPKIPTGDIEVLAQELEILNTCLTPPFDREEPAVNEELRLKYRFIDLRRKEMMEGLAFRYRVTKVVRDYLDRQEFLEIETPCLTRSTPEGARDFLVPSRLSPGDFYALPQSPQLFKQILMVSGYDRYFQLARCFRDEDLRSDRQPEHTQIDLEMSFVDEEDIMKIVEGMVAEVFEKTKKFRLPRPFRVMDYDEAIDRYGTDKPDLRFGMELHDLSAVFEGSGFKVFDAVLQEKGRIRAIAFRPPAGSEFSRKTFDDLTEWIRNYGAKGLAWLKLTGPDSAESPIAKFFDAGRIQQVSETLKASAGDIVFMVASSPAVSAAALGALRCYLAEKYGKINLQRDEILWVKNFPLFEWDDETKRYYALHHPFTAPKTEDVPFLETDPGKVRARAYDLVLNGVEIGGGSIRIHGRDVQEKVFRALGIGDREAEEKFGFLLNALRYGAPPHGGLAMGLDRFTALLLKRHSIREVIAFPKTQKGACLMTDAPGPVSQEQLRELSINVRISAPQASARKS